MSNETKRMNYFNGLLLKEEDLTLDQNYHIHQQRLHNGSFHEWGVVDGLEIEEVPNLPMIIVKQGLAVNKVVDPKTNMMIGQEIWICKNHPDNPVDLSRYNDDENIYIFVRYKEEEADVESNKGGEGKIHKWERAEIKHSAIKPENPREDIIIACVKLKMDINNNKIIDTENIKYDYIVDKDGQKVTVRTYAVTDGNSQEFGQIRIGNKERINLPHIDGKIENNKDGLEINSPFTNFTGKVTSDGLLTTGEAVVNGTLTVNTNNKRTLQVSSEGNVMIGTNAAVSGTLSATGGMIVTGGSTNIETSTVSFKGNILTINNNGDVDESNNSGVAVYRGKDDNDALKPQAKLVWDEKGGVWKAGTEPREGDAKTGLYNLLYGSEWETMRNKSLADEYHRHNGIYDPNNKFVGLSVNEFVNVVIPNSVIVSDSIQTKNGIKAINENGAIIANLFWNENPTENAEVGQWQITDNKGKTYDVAYGDTWKELSQQKNSDMYHHHAVMCAKDGNVTINTNEAGNIEVSNDLTVKKNLIVDGNISVKGEGLQSIKMEQVITEKTIIVNKPEDGKALAAEGGLEVYRGEGLENAKLIWDEGSNKWKIGTGDVLTELPSGDKWERVTGGGIADGLHNHRNLYSEDGVSVITVNKNKNVKIDGDISANNGLSVAKDARIKGALTVDGSVLLNGDITVTGKQTIIDKEIVKVNNSSVLVNQYKSQSTPIENEGGLEVYRGGNVPNARFVWNETEKLWKIGIGENLKTLPCGEKWDTLTENYMADGMHKHSRLYDTKGNSALDINQNGDVNIDNNAYVNGALLVDGSLKVNGKLIVDGVTEYVNKNSIVTNESIISLNNDTNIIADKGGIEITRGDKPKARFIWDEKSKVWKVGIGENLREINPVQLYNDRGDTLALSVRTSGNVDVAHDLLVGQDLTIMGILDVRGQLTRINSSNIEILSNTVVLNRFDEGTLAEHSADSGITVFRGNEKDSPASAAIVWSEKELCWKIGLNGDQKTFKVQSDGSVNSHSYKVQDTLMINNEGIFSNIGTGYGIGIVYGSDRWKIGSKADPGLCVTADGYVGIANIDPKVELDVNGNAKVNGFMTVEKDISVTGNINVTGNAIVNENATVKKNVSVEGSANVNRLTIGNGFTFTKNGIEMNREDNPDSANPKPPARILWDEKTECWKFGSGESFYTLSIEGKDAANYPYQLWTQNKSGVALEINSSGFVGIGTNTPSRRLDVNGDTFIQGELEAKSIKANQCIINNKLTANSFITARYGNEKPAMLQWNESQKRWQAGIEGDLQTIILGNHTHSELSYNNTKIAILEDGGVKVGEKINISKDGKIDAASIKTAGDITVNGILNAEDKLFANKGMTAEADVEIGTSNKTAKLNVYGETRVKGTLNADDITNVKGMLFANGGLTVSADSTINGKLIANQGLTAAADVEIGTSDKAAKLNVYGETKVTGILSADNTTNVKGMLNANGGLTVSADSTINGKLIANKGMTAAADVEIGTSTKTAKLNVYGETTVKGTLNADDITKVKGMLFANGGLTVAADGLKSKVNDSIIAQIKYDVVEGWQAGTEGDLKTLCLKEDINKLEGIAEAIIVSDVNDGNGNIITKSDFNTDYTNINGKLVANGGFTSAADVEIGTNESKANLTVTGDTTINGKITVSDGIEIKSSSDSKIHTLKIVPDNENETYKLVLEIDNGTNKVTKVVSLV